MSQTVSLCGEKLWDLELLGKSEPDLDAPNFEAVSSILMRAKAPAPGPVVLSRAASRRSCLPCSACPALISQPWNPNPDFWVLFFFSSVGKNIFED